MIAAYFYECSPGQNDKFQNQLSPFNPGKSCKRTFLHVLTTLFIHLLILILLYMWSNEEIPPQITRQKTPTSILPVVPIYLESAASSDHFGIHVTVAQLIDVLLTDVWKHCSENRHPEECNWSLITMTINKYWTPQ